MAEPSTATGSGVAESEQDVLLATKLHVPRRGPGFVPRSRLVEALDEGLARGLVLVCAPAGFGKTALLADWARRGRRPVAWLSLDTGDNDPARFWRHAAAALDQVRPGIAERLGPLLGPPRAAGTWAWRRWPTSGGSLTMPCGMSPRASRRVGSSPTRSLWPQA